MEEIWKDVIGYEELYKISNYGRLKTTKTGKIRKFSINPRGYERALLKKDNTIKMFFAHRLVFCSFNYRYVNDNHHIHHINGIKTDNRLINLKEVTSEFNQERKLYKSNPKKGIKSPFNKRVLNTIATIEERYDIKTLEELKSVLRNL